MKAIEVKAIAYLSTEFGRNAGKVKVKRFLKVYVDSGGLIKILVVDRTRHKISIIKNIGAPPHSIRNSTKATFEKNYHKVLSKFHC